MTEAIKDAAETTAHDQAASSPTSPANRNAGRYTAELAERILNEVQSGRALLSVCRDAGVPSYNTVYGWVVRDVEGFAARYARARDIGGRRGARAIQYTTELADHIVREVESGRSLHDVCRDDGMPVSAAFGYGCSRIATASRRGIVGPASSAITTWPKSCARSLTTAATTGWNAAPATAGTRPC